MLNLQKKPIRHAFESQLEQIVEKIKTYYTATGGTGKPQ